MPSNACSFVNFYVTALLVMMINQSHLVPSNNARVREHPHPVDPIKIIVGKQAVD
ncbi:hypothetical protein PR001_g4817 [Phytophthora rubi]|uniref:RxLR effector protein n=1 Tax=Phytophthora rubi TaxID=129364 RepID=A0A6A3NWE2_9STRA|nr:hypothetical protein PR002_g5056 [Phytophthora rubi]KAE9045805.1 hypothetical protein PR001_g4817 [Phytophthora rubi]